MRCRRRRLPRSRPLSRPAPTRRVLRRGAGAPPEFDALAARDLLERAVAADGRFPLAHSALALTWATLGYDDRARSASSGPSSCLPVCRARNGCRWKARIGRRRRSGQEAIDIYQTLFRFFPDNLEYGLRLANAENSSGAPKARSPRLRRCASPRRTSEPRHRARRGGCGREHLGLQTHAAAAATAAARGKALGARLIVARARTARRHGGAAARGAGAGDHPLRSGACDLRRSRRPRAPAERAQQSGPRSPITATPPAARSCMPRPWRSPARSASSAWSRGC